MMADFLDKVKAEEVDLPIDVYVSVSDRSKRFI
jgi:hypothetical protein